MNKMTINRRDFLKLAGLGAGAVLVSCLPTAGPDPEPATAIPSPLPTLVPPSPVPADGVVILADGLNFPEGPAFAPDGSLWCTEMLAGNLIRWTNESGLQRIPTGGKPNGLAIDYMGRAWVCDSSLMAIRRYDPANNQWENISMMVEGHFLQNPNDLCFDEKGNLLFTCPNFNEAGKGYVCCLKPDLTVTKIATDMYTPNGLDVVDGGRSLVVGDTLQKKLFKGSWDADKTTLSDFQPWVDIGGNTGPDGMVPGADGLLYVAIYGDGVVKAVNGAGDITGIYSLPGLNPTNVAVDPSGRLGLVVTEAEKGRLFSLPFIQPGVSIFDGQG